MGINVKVNVNVNGNNNVEVGNTTIDNSKVTNQNLINDKDMRDDSLAKLVDKMKNDALVRSDIWNLGEDSVFHTVFGEYMTIKQIAALFGLELNDKGDCKTIETYLKDERNGKKNEYKDELIKAGVKKFTKSELENLKNSIPSERRDCETVGNTQIDETPSFAIPNRGCIIFPLRAVIKLGMFMTGTEKAKLFRDKIIDELALGQTAQETADEYFEAMFDKENIKLYANDTEKLLELLDISFKYDLMKGIIRKDTDPMKRKVKMIDARKAEFEKDIQGYQQQIDAYVKIDEDLFFDKIETLKTKISETNRIIAALDGVFRTLTLRLRAVDVVVNKMSLKSGSASNNMDGVKATITKIRKIIAEDRPVPPELQGAFDVRKMNKLLRDELGLIDTEGVYAIVTDSKGNEKELTGHVIEDAWVERYTEEFINSIQSGQERNGNSACKFIKWSEFGMRFISLLFYKHYVENWDETDFFKLTEDDWKKLVYDGYIEEKMREYNSL